jgi:hypothetical protein
MNEEDGPRSSMSTDDDAGEHLDDEPGAGRAAGNLEGPIADERADPAFAPVIEAGGGVAEGFEQAEAALVEHATDPDLLGTKHITADAGRPEDPEMTEYGEADQERSSELRD